ncbi:MAG: glycoside hydrolase family 9 protein, partial [Desulfobacterales bacterium]|nr:glycoside hydrolase family 9 protein [Desulfobacterales bacterium]
WMKDPYRPALGALSVPDCVHAIYAHILTGDANYLKAVILATQTGLGANPLNMSYTTGVGKKYPKNPLHVDSRVSLQEAPAGITVLGPVDYSVLDESDLHFHKLAGRYCYPDINKWPVIESYWDVFWYPMMCEFSIQSIAPNVFVWGYLAAQGVK